MNTDHLESAVVGSSIATTFISLAYIGLAFHKSRHGESSPNFHMEKVAIAVPVLFAIANIVLVAIAKDEVEYDTQLVIGAGVGAVLGLVMATGGTMTGANKMFPFPFKGFQFVAAPVLYASIIAGIQVHLNRRLGLLVK